MITIIIIVVVIHNTYYYNLYISYHIVIFWSSTKYTFKIEGNPQFLFFLTLSYFHINSTHVCPLDGRLLLM